MRIVGLAALLIFFPLIGEDVVSYNSLRFSGLENVSKYDIVRSSGIKSDNGRIVVDKSLLEKVLTDNPLIKSYKLIDKNGTLTIIVLENLPEIPAFVVGDKSSRFCELDSSFLIVSIGKVHSISVPLITLPVSAFDGNQLKDDEKRRISNVIENARNSPIWKEISGINFQYADRIIVTLKSRFTSFILVGDNLSFKRLYAFAGYLDIVKRYPEIIDLREKVLVINWE